MKKQMARPLTPDERIALGLPPARVAQLVTPRSMVRNSVIAEAYSQAFREAREHKRR